jgi:recombinational DNA repair protein RecT
MAQTTTQSRPRGQSSSQQQAPREAPRDNLPATRGEAPAGRGRGMSQAQRGAQGLSNLPAVMGRFVQEVDAWSRSLYEVGRSAQEANFFREVLLTAVAEKPELLFADRRTFFNSAKKCFLDGCLPDGRDAALVIFNTKIKVRDSEGIDVEASIQAVQYMPMVQGIRRKMLESGMVLVAFADAVYEKDTFRHTRGLHPNIEHEAPALGGDRGKLIGAYAVIKLANGEVLLDSMAEKEILAAKAKSRAPNAMLWADFPWEAYKKTVLRRLAKSAPINPNIRRLVDREDETFEGELDTAGTMRSPAPRFDYPTYATPEPEPQPAEDHRSAPSTSDVELTFDVVNLDGQVTAFASAFRAFDAVIAIFAEAARLGVSRIDGFWESNQDLLDQLSLAGSGNLSDELAQRYTDARDAAEDAESARRREDEDRKEREAAARAADQKVLAQRAEEDRRRQAAADEATAQQGDEGANVAAEGERGTPGASVAGAGDDTFPGDLPSGQSLRQDDAAATAQVMAQVAPITVPVKGNKPDFRTFAIALLGPKIRATKSSVDLAHLLGANADSLERCRAPGVLSKDDLAALEETIAAQFAKLPADN